MENINKLKFMPTLLLLITTTALFAQIPDPGFENWTSGSCGYSYNTPTGWGSINSSTCILDKFTVQKTTTPAHVHSGTAALELYSQYVSVEGETAPGICVTGTINTGSGTVSGGFPINFRPDKFIGWYQYAPSSPDTFGLEVSIYSGVTSVTTSMGYGQATGSSTVSTYTKFIANITYNDPTTPADSAQIILICSNGTNGTNQSTSGTIMYIDDIAFVSCATFASTHTTVSPSCNTATGSITLTTPVNGTGPYTYAWGNGSTATSLTSLAPGNYKVTVTDDNTCTALDSINLVAANVPFTVNATGSVTSCTSNTGTVTASASAGNSPYTYLWSNSTTGTQITGLGAGNYPVTVTDANGCTTSATGAVTTPNGPTAVDTVTNLRCYNDNTGAIAVTVSGGTSPLNYAWNNSATTASLTNIAAGNYSLVISDQNNCSFEVTATVTQPTALSLVGGETNIGCHGGLTGTAYVTASNGTAPYYYSWNNGADTSVLANLPAGTYVAAVADNNGCPDTLSLTITQPAAVVVTIAVTNASASNASDGSAIATASGGTGTLTYLWGVIGSANDTVTNLAPATYCVVVTDSNNCTASACDSVGYSQGTNGITVVSSVSFKVYPNPANNQLTVESSSTDGKFQFNLYSLDGRLVEQTIIAGEKSVIMLNMLTDGLYTYQLKDAATGAINYGKLEIQR